MQYGREPGRIETALVEGARHIRLIGECDIATAELLNTRVGEMIHAGETRIVFDLEHATFLDSSILRIFLIARRHAAPNGGTVTLLCRPGFVRRLLALLEMDRLLRICTPEEWRQQIAAVH